MMQPRPLSMLLHDESGATLIEFALLAPAFIGMFMGVLQIGLQMQNYNAVRSVASDIARNTTVQCQKVKNEDADCIDLVRIKEVTMSRASSTPYLLNLDRLDVTVLQEADSRVDGAREITLTITYDTPGLLGVLDVEALDLVYSRPIFVAEAAAL